MNKLHLSDLKIRLLCISNKKEISWDRCYKCENALGTGTKGHGV